uniref:attractin-like protein 1 n=1 Tax=Ciona intestinalis TaxID=7719 RepID=UPI0002B8EB12|nr:attractin-like protein 1 [Ciona intestinalis]|eukprot:XP_002121132.4 attractin-like protein 1 [Ciona intestinalis]
MQIYWLVGALVLSSFFFESYCECNVNSTTEVCLMGDCIGGACVCHNGWAGDLCDHCDGRILLDTDNGMLSDSPGDYAAKSKCSWLIAPKNSTSPLRLSFNEFKSECGWDYLYIHDGDSAFSPLIASMNGITYPAGQNNSYNPEIIATSGKAFIHFYSDVAYTMSGFNMTYTVDECVYDCFNRGNCTVGKCECGNGWHGSSCQAQTCPNNCSAAQNYGKCSSSYPVDQCDCETGHTGQDCSLPAPSTKGVWDSFEFNPRATTPSASYAAVSVDHQIWVYGGMKFGVPTMQDLFMYNVSSQVWSTVVTSNQTYPQSRYGHTMVAWENSLIVFGGKLTKTEKAVDHIWQFDKINSTWMKIDYDVTFNKQLNNETSVLELSGHTADIVTLNNNVTIMLVMFGYHPVMSYSQFVYEYDIINKTWHRPQTGRVGKNKIPGLFGHTTVYDPTTNLIYIHGGAISVLSSIALVSTTYAYNPNSKCFTILKSSDQPRYLHSASLINGVMYVYGGNTHNDTNESKGALCYSPSFMAYNIQCNSWHTLKEQSNSLNPSRFGHDSVVVTSQSPTMTNSLFIFSGYDGMMVHDVLTYQPGSCEAIFNETTCIGREDLSCMWDGKKCGLGAFNDTDTCKKGRSNIQTSCSITTVDFCKSFSNCYQCNSLDVCLWTERGCEEKLDDSVGVICSTACSMATTCSSCVTTGACMWCLNQQQCISTNSYVVQYPYGQCLEWTNKGSCPLYECSALKTCGDCQHNPKCGWCDDGLHTGLGTCMEGSSAGPMVFDNVTENYQVSAGMCGTGWYFTSCPLCQCNGHSKCDANNVCINCENNTTGDQCQTCALGYYGDPRNGNNCTQCECGIKAESCNSATGACNCDTKGVNGRSCEACDTDNGYTGNATGNGTCFYSLLINYQFTFNLKSDADDTYVTKINFKNIPPLEEDVQMNFLSSQSSNIRFAVISTATQIAFGGEQTILLVENVTDYTFTFYASKYRIGQDGLNTTVRIYVSDFKTPSLIKISLLQRSNRLLKILLILFSSFLVILLIAAVTWKMKMMYDVHRLRANRAVEMAEMAARPFAAIDLCCDDMYRSTQALMSKEETEICSLVLTPEAICEEKCSNDQVSVVSVFLWLPTSIPSDEVTKTKSETNSDTPPYFVTPPPGQCGLAIGTALIQGTKSTNTTPSPNIRRPHRNNNNNPSSINSTTIVATPNQEAYDNHAMAVNTV